MSEIDNRRNFTAATIAKLRSHLPEASARLGDKACVYMTGSYGRLEAGSGSDLDLFIVGKNSDKQRGDVFVSALKRLDDICVKADLIDATRKIGIKEFDGDGKYLTHYSVSELTKTLGKPEDDVLNTFTARLLLLLESHPLLQDDTYREILDEVIAAYWEDYEDHKSSFMPAFLTNDILRLWRTFCVNYEARTSKFPDENKIWRKLKNYTLKHSRLLTCYSAIIYLLYVYNKNGTVSPGDAVEMIALSPSARVEWLIANVEDVASTTTLAEVRDRYNRFLEVKAHPEKDLFEQFRDIETAAGYIEEANEFGMCVFRALSQIGGESKFHRLLVV